MALLEVRPGQDERTFELDGELDMGSTEVLLRATASVAEGGEDLVLDASKLRFIDSSGLRAILQLARTRTEGSSVVVVHPSPAVERVLAITVPHEIPGLRVELNGGGGA